MSDLLISLAFFVCLAASALLTLYAYPKLTERHRDDRTRDVVRQCAGIFVVMTSPGNSGLMVNSAKNTFESVDKNVHAYATELILLDRTLRQYGPETAAARGRLLAYVKQAAARMAQSDPVLGSRTAEALLDDVSEGIGRSSPPTPSRRRCAPSHGSASIRCSRCAGRWWSGPRAPSRGRSSCCWGRG